MHKTTNPMPKTIDKAELESEAEVELYEELRRYARDAQDNGYHPLQLNKAMRNVAVDMRQKFKRGAHKVGSAEVDEAEDD